MVLPLLATQILWINLITDSGAGAGHGRRPAERRRDGRARRAACSERVIDARMWSGVLQIGLVMALATLF